MSLSRFQIFSNIDHSSLPLSSSTSFSSHLPIQCCIWQSFSFHTYHVSQLCKSYSFTLLYHRFLCSKFFSCLLISDSSSSASTSDPSQPRHFFNGGATAGRRTGIFL